MFLSTLPTKYGLGSMSVKYSDRSGISVLNVVYSSNLNHGDFQTKIFTSYIKTIIIILLNMVQGVLT